MNNKNTILEVKNIVKKFETKVSNNEKNTALIILDQLSLSLSKGESVAILGKSGSGKSSFLSLVAGLDQPNSGEILINGVDITQMEEKKLADFRARKISIIFQQFHLLPHFTAKENISLPLELLDFDPKEIEASTSESLAAVGLTDRAHHFPRELSGGEQQRVAIARAMIVKPDLILADEPTGNLDNQTNKQVTDRFFNIIEENKLSLVLVTHDESIAKKCDRRYHLSEGRLTQLK